MHDVSQAKHPSEVSQGQDKAGRQDVVYCDRSEVEMDWTQQKPT